MNALDTVLKDPEIRNQTALASKVGVSQQAVSIWLRAGLVSADYVILVAAAVDYRVTPHELRPDLYPHPEDGLPADMRAKAAE